MSAQPRNIVHAGIKPENTPELASRYLNVPNMPWQKAKFAGIEILGWDDFDPARVDKKWPQPGGPLWMARRSAKCVTRLIGIRVYVNAIRLARMFGP